MESKDVILFVYDTPTNFEESKTHIGHKEITYKNIINFNSLEKFNKELNSNDISDDDFILVVIHVFSETLNGVREFHVSGIQESYPLLQYKYITNKGTINEMCKKAIDDDLPLCKNDVFKYHEIRDYIRNNGHKIPTKKQLQIGALERLTKITKKGIFLSHSSKNADIVIKFRDIILIGGLGCELDDIMLTSDESTAINEGVSIPSAIKNHLQNKSGLFIQFVSDEYTKSRVCVNEEGAAWVLLDDNMYLTIILNGFTTKEITWVKTVDKGIKIDNKESLSNIYDNRKSFFGEINTTHFNKKIEEFLTHL